MLDNIKKNVTKTTLKDVSRLNYLLISLVFLCSLFFLLLFENRWVTIIMALKSGCYIYIVSFGQAYLLRRLASRFGDNLRRFRVLRFLLSYIFGVALYLALWHIFASLAGILSRTNDLKWMLCYVMVAVIINSIILFLHDFVIIRRSKIENDMEISRLQMRNAEAENLLLKQQIQPHFLFNALNTLKALIKTNPKLGEQYLIQLADFLRATVSHNRAFSATVAEELEICRNYMAMQKIRFGESLEWDQQISDRQTLEGSLPSFSLQPLVENAIKHNSFTKEQPLRISICEHDGMIQVVNNINTKVCGAASIKTGLSNLAERCELLSGHQLIVKNDGNNFCVALKIIPDEGYHH